MSLFIKKPVFVEAWQWDGTTDWTTAPEWLQKVIGHWSPKSLLIPTLEGNLTASPGDWILKGVKGEIYPCKPDIFALTHEPVEDSTRSLGKLFHSCADWDFLLIDEYCSEFSACSCEWRDPEQKALAIIWNNIIFVGS